jgi:hypothetical protein
MTEEELSRRLKQEMSGEREPHTPIRIHMARLIDFCLALALILFLAFGSVVAAVVL